MAPLLEMARLVFASLPSVLLSRWAAILLAVAVLLVFLQYRRLATVEAEIHGLVMHRPVEQTFYSLMVGSLGGMVGSLILSWTGVGLVDVPGGVSALLFLWPLAFVMGLVNPRFLCFAYGTSLLGLSRLLFGWPQVDLPSLLGLVAVLHMVEALLIWWSGATCATPMSIDGPMGQAKPGFTLQRFWPVPLVLPYFAAGLGSPVEMGSWWPVLAPDPAVSGGMAAYGWQLLPVVVTLGYSDLAITAPPWRRARQSALVLLGYSSVLLLLAAVGSHVRPVLWVGVLFSALGHEAMAVWSGRVQLLGLPYLARPARGVAVLDVVPGTTAAAAGLRSGSVILAVEDTEVHSREELHNALLASPAYVRIMFRRDRELDYAKLPRPDDGLLSMGLILLPEPGDLPIARLRRPRFFRWTGLEK